MKRPTFFLACMVLLGAIAGHTVLLPRGVVLGVLALLLAVCGVLARRALRPDGAPLRPALTRLLLAILFGVAFFQQNQEVRRERIADRQVERLARAGAVTLRGTVADEPSRRGERQDRIVMTLRDVAVRTYASQGPSGPEAIGPGEDNATQSHEGLRLACRVRLTLSGRAAEQAVDTLPIPGQGLEILYCRLRLPPRAVRSDLFDYRAFLRRRGIGAIVSVYKPARVRRLEAEDRRIQVALYSRLVRWRRSALRRMEETLAPGRAGVLRCMLLGETGGLSQTLRRDFTQTGIGHLFAVSGLHTALLAGMIFLLCRIVMMPPRAASWVMIGSLCVFLVLVGFRPPAVRASIMAFCLTIPFIARRAVDSLNALSLAVFVTVLVNPQAPFRTDFQFSYLCVLGLITLSPAIRETLSITPPERTYGLRRRLIGFHNGFLAGGLSLVIGVQMAVLPLLSILDCRAPPLPVSITY